jgi:hypothetical protein
MRRAYHRVARDSRLGVVTVCLQLRLAAALARNSARAAATRVSEATIERMAEVMQWPDQPWERHTITLEQPSAEGAAASASPSASSSSAAAAAAAAGAGDATYSIRRAVEDDAQGVAELWHATYFDQQGVEVLPPSLLEERRQIGLAQLAPDLRC